MRNLLRKVKIRLVVVGSFFRWCPRFFASDSALRNCMPWPAPSSPGELLPKKHPPRRGSGAQHPALPRERIGPSLCHRLEGALVWLRAGGCPEGGPGPGGVRSTFSIRDGKSNFLYLRKSKNPCAKMSMGGFCGKARRVCSPDGIRVGSTNLGGPDCRFGGFPRDRGASPLMINLNAPDGYFPPARIGRLRISSHLPPGRERLTILREELEDAARKRQRFQRDFSFAFCPSPREKGLVSISCGQKIHLQFIKKKIL